MNPQLLESLLYQEESETLDFKEEQYPFDHATDEQKGELLKDILAFANAWRQTDAYILVGVKEVRGGRSIVRGMSHHLLNRNLQQFVHSKTNRPVNFFYSPIAFENADIGIITIPLQDRPLFIVRPYGKLHANTVYIRRGETTDTVKDPEELVRMGVSAVLARSQPALEFEFADLKERKSLGANLELESNGFDVPDIKSIPDYGQSSYQSFFGGVPRNHDYYRDIARYLRDMMHLRPVGLAITNPSPTLAENVIVTLRLDNVEGLSVMDESDRLPEPSTDWMPGASFARNNAPYVSVRRYGDVHEIRADIGNIQPGTTEWSAEPFYIGTRRSTTVTAQIAISANNLSVPLSSSAQIAMEASERRIEVNEILNIKRTTS